MSFPVFTSNKSSSVKSIGHMRTDSSYVAKGPYTAGDKVLKKIYWAIYGRSEFSPIRIWKCSEQQCATQPFTTRYMSIWSVNSANISLFFPIIRFRKLFIRSSSANIATLFVSCTYRPVANIEPRTNVTSSLQVRSKFQAQNCLILDMERRL